MRSELWPTVASQLETRLVQGLCSGLSIQWQMTEAPVDQITGSRRDAHSWHLQLRWINVHIVLKKERRTLIIQKKGNLYYFYVQEQITSRNKISEYPIIFHCIYVITNPNLLPQQPFHQQNNIKLLSKQLPGKFRAGWIKTSSLGT